MFPLPGLPSPREVIFFMLVLSRIAGLFAAIPIFGGRRLPVRIRIVTIVAITLVCFPVLALTPPNVMPDDTISLIFLILREVMVGLTMAFVTQIIFSAIEFSGQIIGIQMGFSISSIIDPMNGVQTQIMAVMQTLLATLLFLALDIHHLFIRSIVDSFRIIPLGAWSLNGELVQFFVRATSEVFVLGVRLAAPVLVAMFLTSVTLGIMARAFPQMNVFMISMPLNIGIGFIVLGLTLPIFFHVLEVSFGSLKGQIDTLFKLMSKGG